MPPQVPLQDKTLAQAVADSYASLIKARIIDFEYCSIILKNTDTANDLTYQVLVSNDPQGGSGTWANVELNADGDTEVALGEGALTAIALSAPFVWVDVQVKNTVAESAAEASAWLVAR